MTNFAAKCGLTILTALFLLVTGITGLAQSANQSAEGAPPLPAGMTGADANDPRAKLKPGLYDAGEVAKGLRHLLLLKKPEAFQLDASDA